MGILIEASINCDLSPDGKQCYSCMEVDICNHLDNSEDYIYNEAVAAKWVYLPESGNWACPQCAKKFGGAAEIKKKDFEGTL